MMRIVSSASHTNKGISTTWNFIPNLSLFIIPLPLLLLCSTGLGNCLYLRCNRGIKVHESAIQFPTEEELQHRREQIPSKTKQEVCPVSDYHFHQETQRCYKSGTAGPCGRNKIFGPIPDSPDDILGECYCVESVDPMGGTVIYDQVTNSCFPIFTQGPCGPEEWVTFDPHIGRYKCQENPCLPISFEPRYGSGGDESQSKFVLLNGRCVRLGHSAPECEASTEVVQFVPGIVLPVCMSTDVSSFAIGVLARRRCKPGTSRSPTGKCIKNFFWW